MKKILLTLMLGLTFSSNMLAMNNAPDKIWKKIKKLSQKIYTIYEAERSMLELPSSYDYLKVQALKKRAEDKYKELRSMCDKTSTLEELSLAFKQALLVGKLYNTYHNKTLSSSALGGLQRLQVGLLNIKTPEFVRRNLAIRIANKLIYTKPKSYRKQFLENLDPKRKRFFNF